MENQKLRNQAESTLQDWHQAELKALALLNIVGQLKFDKSVDLLLFRNAIYDTRPSGILNLLDISKNYTDEIIDISTCLAMAEELQRMNLAPARIDIGTLAMNYKEASGKKDIASFVRKEIQNLSDIEPKNEEAKDIVLYGFGRIGRLAARIIVGETGKGEQLRLKAIVIRPKLKDQREEALKRAALLMEDSVHGSFKGRVSVNEDGSQMNINGNIVYLIYAGHPSDIDYTTYGIQDAIVIDNTGVWRDEAELSQHLRPGVAKVILTAPGKGAVSNIVFGVNESNVDLDSTNVLSAASCTTNAIVPVLHIIENRLGVHGGHIETIHSYTNDQNLIDNFHKKPRRGRAAALNMVLTSTGAATAVSKVIPALAGKLTGNAVRVPTPNVSIAILNLTLKKATNLDELNDMLKSASLHGNLVDQIHYSKSTEYVSSNAIGMTATSVVDAPSTIVSDDGLRATIYLWYDNEYGYTWQVVRLAKHVAEVRRHVYY